MSEDESKEAASAASAAPAVQDLIGGVTLVAIAAISFSQMGPTFADWIYPRVLTDIMVTVGAFLIVKWGIRFVLHRHGGRVDLGSLLRQRVVRDVALFILGIAFYVLLQSIIGFWISSFLMLLFVPFFLSLQRTAKELVLESVIALLACAVAYVIFEYFFLVPLPTGILFGG